MSRAPGRAREGRRSVRPLWAAWEEGRAGGSRLLSLRGCSLGVLAPSHLACEAQLGPPGSGRSPPVCDGGRVYKVGTEALASLPRSELRGWAAAGKEPALGLPLPWAAGSLCRCPAVCPQVFLL